MLPVLVGDFPISRAVQMNRGAGSLRVMKVSRTTTTSSPRARCCSAQLRERYRRAEYLRVIRYTTAKVFEAATRWAQSSQCGARSESAMAASACTSEPRYS